MFLSLDRKATVESLKAWIAQKGAAPRSALNSGLPCGSPELTEALGSWPTGGIVEIRGRKGSGRLAAVWPAIAWQTGHHRSVAIVDPLCQVFPPGLMGVVLERLLLVRPNASAAGWTCEQLLQSAAFSLVLWVDPLRLDSSLGARLGLAAREGECTLIVASETSHPALPAHMRLYTHGWEIGPVSAEGEQKVGVQVHRAAKGVHPEKRIWVGVRCRSSERSLPEVQPSHNPLPPKRNKNRARHHWGDALQAGLFDSRQ